MFDSSPHVWTHSDPVDITPDEPYASWSDVGGNTSLAAQHAGTSKLGFIGGAGIEGGQGNADSIYGSHDDHSTYGVAGSGWQGPGNGEAPGDLWNPIVAPHNGMAPASLAAQHAGTSKLGFIGGAGIEGGQGNADSIYGSHDDHSTYGVAGSGWQGPGNGEAPGDLWNPIVAPQNGMAPAQQLAAPVPVPAAGATGKLASVPEEGCEAEGGCKTVRSSPGHLMLMGHAMIFGALSATFSSDTSSSWSDKFKQSSVDACESVTPVGGYVLKTHVL